MRFLFIPFFLVALLNGCTAPGNMKAGLSEPDAIKSMGQPRAVYVLPDGTRRLWNGKGKQGLVLDFHCYVARFKSGDLISLCSGHATCLKLPDKPWQKPRRCQDHNQRH